jgi:hypothetical protein
MLSKISQNKGNMNMEEIMKMNEVLKPYQERSKDTGGDNFKTKCTEIEVIINKLDRFIRSGRAFSKM